MHEVQICDACAGTVAGGTDVDGGYSGGTDADVGYTTALWQVLTNEDGDYTLHKR